MTTQNPNQNRNIPPINSPPLSSGNPQACAACKYQRRRCAPDCPLAPFFPASCPKELKNARGLFGVKNISKVARSMSPLDRERAVKSMIYEANIRAVDPVGGCYWIINDLKKQVADCEYELCYCKAMNDYFRGESCARNPNFGMGERNDLNVGAQQIDVNGIMNVDSEGFGVKNLVNGDSSSGLKNNGEAFGVKKVFNGATSSGLKKFDNGVCSSGSGLSVEGGLLRDADLKPFLKLESTKPNQLRESVALKEDDVEATQPPKQLQKHGENCLVKGNS